MSDASKPRVKVYWVRSPGEQEGLDIPIHLPNEDRWCETTIQSVYPGNNSVAMKYDYLELVRKDAYDELHAENERLWSALLDIETLAKNGHASTSGLSSTIFVNIMELVNSVKVVPK